MDLNRDFEREMKKCVKGVKNVTIFHSHFPFPFQIPIQIYDPNIVFVGRTENQAVFVERLL